MRAAFVGRDAEVAALEALWEQVRARPGPAAAVVVGDPGSGKSRLLSELALRISAVEPIPFNGYELERQIPLAAARSLLQRVRAAADVALAVDPLAPGSDRGADVVEPIRVFEAAHRALASLGPMLLLVDDLHWVDDMSLALLHYLARAAHTVGQPLAVVAASRPAPGTVSMRSSLRALLGNDRLLEIELGPLDEDEGVRLALELAPDAGQERARRVWRSSGGSPFWLEILARSDDLDVDVDRVLAERLTAAGDDAVTVLALLSAVAHPLAVDEIAQIVGWSLSRADDTAAMLERRGLASRVAHGVAISHDLIREGASRSVPVDRARRLHRQVGHWLEAVAPNDDDRLLLEALEHRRAGGEAALTLALRLARSPRRRLLGVTGLRRLITIAEEGDAHDPDTSALLDELAQLAAELGEHEQAGRLWSERASLASEPGQAARAALGASRASLELARRHDAWGFLEQARALDPGDPVLEVELLAQEAAVQHYLERQPHRARSTAQRALGAARSLVQLAGGVEQLDDQTRRALLSAILVATDGALMGDDPEELLALSEELAATARGFDERIEMKALVVGSMALRFLGQNVDAEARLRHAWVKARSRVLPQAVLEIGATLGRVLLTTGKLDEATAVIAECRALGTRLTEFRPARAFTVTLAWLVELTTGDWQRAIAGLRAEADAETQPHYRLQAHLERAAAIARLDRHHAADDVRTATAAGLADAVAAGCRRCLTETTVRSAEALARTGQPDEASRLLELATVPVADAHLSLFQLRAKAAILAATGHRHEAAALLHQIIAAAEHQHLRLEALWGRLDLGQLLSDDNRHRATTLLRDAGAEAGRIGATTEARVADSVLRSLGVRTWRRPSVSARHRDPLEALTDRERQVARMIASGASNPEIAATLFLSRKTVERHVSNILAKLGLRNRAELAALVADNPDPPRPR